MRELISDTGVVEYSVNGKCTIHFNPTDSEFISRLFSMFDYLDKKQEEFRGEVTKLSDKRKIFDIAKKRDKEMRELIDGLFGVPVCEAVFGDVNVYALGGGLPVWCNLMLAIMDEIDTSFAREQKATNPRIKKHLEKYNKR